MEQQEFDLTKRLKGLWRFKWIIAIMVLIAGGITLGFTANQPPVYGATATLMVESGEPPLALPVGFEITYLQDIESQIEVMKSRSVLERAITQLEPEKATNPQYLQLEVEKLQDALSIQQVRGTSLVALTVVSSDPVLAQKQANAVAEAYVYDVNKARLTAIESAVENITTQLKELRASEVDLSISPSLPRITAQLDASLVALETASEHLEKQDDTSSQVYSLISERAETVASEANRLYMLVQELALKPVDIAVVESQTRALAIKIEVLSAQVATVREEAIDTQLQKQMLDVEELVQVASSTTGAILDQVIALSEALDDEGTGANQVRANLQYRIAEHTTLVATTLETASAQLQQVATSTWQPLQTLQERVTTAIATLQALSQQLNPPSSKQGVFLSYAEINSMEIHAQAAATTLALLLTDVEDIQEDEFTSQIYSEMDSFQEWVTVANDAVSELPEEVAGLAEGGGSSLSYGALNSLRQELQLALLTSDGNGVRVVDMAVVSPTTISTLERYRSVFMAVVAALLLGIMIALVFQYFDRRVRDASQVTSYVGLPLLASVITTPTIGSSHPPSILNGSAPQYLETFRMLRTNLGLDSYQGQVLLVSSPEEKEGKTTVAANLARVVALQGRKVLLIDGSLRKPDVAAAFGLTEAEGLSDSLTRESEPWDHIIQADGVDILPAGTASAKSAELLSSPQMKALLEKAKQTYDVVIVDSAPVMGYADTRILAKEVSEALLVLQPDTSRLDLVKDSWQALVSMGVRVVGFALNKVGAKELKYFYPVVDNKSQVQG